MPVSLRSRVGVSTLPCLLASTALAPSAWPVAYPINVALGREACNIEKYVGKVYRLKGKTFLHQAATWCAPVINRLYRMSPVQAAVGHYVDRLHLLKDLDAHHMQ